VFHASDSKVEASLWSRVDVWSIRDFVVAMAILTYMSSATGRKAGRWSKLLRLWARAQGVVAVDPSAFEAPFRWPRAMMTD
jgi:hypothetical protein